MAVARDKFRPALGAKAGASAAALSPADAVAFAVTDLGNALESVYRTDAHLVAYVLWTDGAPATHQPRVAKTAPGDIIDRLFVDVLFADIDRPDHAPWPDDSAAIAAARRALDQAQTAGVYITARGLRLVQPLNDKLPVDSAEAAIRGWHLDLAARGLDVDVSAADWTRHFRLPHVRRDGRPYRSPLVDIDRMRPIRITAATHARCRVGRGGPLPEVAFAADLPERYHALVVELALVVSRYATTRHNLFMCLVGALLGSRRLLPEHAVAFAEALAYRTGAVASDARTIGATTARKWVARMPLRARRQLEQDYPDVAAVLFPRPVAAPAAAAPAYDLAEAQRRLHHALLDAPDGVSLVATPCGFGKTQQAALVAAERAARAGASRQNTRTSIAVPAHKQARDLVSRLHGLKVPVLRVFGPLSLEGPHDGHECRYHAAGAALAVGRQSVARTLCSICEHRLDCRAVDGLEGPEDARVVVGPHAKLAELDGAAGTTGLLVVDEPPSLLEDETITPDDLRCAAEHLGRFAARYAAGMAPALVAVTAWLASPTAPIRQTGSVARAFDPPLVDVDLEPSGAMTIAEAVAGALEPRQFAPPLDKLAVIHARSSPLYAKRLGNASRVLAALHRAVTSPEARVTIYDDDAGARTLVVTAIWTALDAALHRDGKIVILAADADLHRPTLAERLPYLPPLLSLEAGDGAPIARTLLTWPGATRSAWRDGGGGSIRAAVDAAVAWINESPDTTSVGVVTFLEHEPLVAGWMREALPDVQLAFGHFGAMRGVDDWRAFDAVVTIGDPRMNLDAADRRKLDVDEDAKAELEQCHGRLRTVHRTRPGRALHVGMLMPRAWRDPVDVRAPQGAGRPRRDGVDLEELKRAVERQGGVSGTARRCGVDRRTVQRWLREEGRPDASARTVLFGPGDAGGSPTWEGAALIPTTDLYRDSRRRIAVDPGPAPPRGGQR